MTMALFNTTIVGYPLFFPSVGPMELAVVFTVVLILFGPGKLPDVFRALGDGVRQFKDASKGSTNPSIEVKPQVSLENQEKSEKEPVGTVN